MLAMFSLNSEEAISCKSLDGRLSAVYGRVYSLYVFCHCTVTTWQFHTQTTVILYVLACRNFQKSSQHYDRQMWWLSWSGLQGIHCTCQHVWWSKAYSVLVEEIQNHVGQSGVAPVTVDQQELLEVSETWEGKVTRHHRLQNSTKKPKRFQHSIFSIIPLSFRLPHTTNTQAHVTRAVISKWLARLYSPASF